MSFSGTDQYRLKTLGLKNFPPFLTEDYHALCDHIDELRKEADFWKTQAQKWEQRVRVPASSQYEELERENAELRGRVEQIESEAWEMAGKLEKRHWENAGLRKALEFYADLSNWWEDWWEVIEQPPAAVADGGHNARTALKKQ